MEKVVSFDLDGTLVHTGYPDHVWLTALPKLYSQHHDIDYETARKYILKEYEKIGPERIEWYDIDYWFKKFKLTSSWMELLKAHTDKIQAFSDVEDTLLKLKNKGLPLIIISNAKKEFIDIQLNHTGLTKYFTHIFSCTSDFGAVKKVSGFYQHILDLLEIEANCMYHIGDHYKFDFEVPRQLGINSYYLDRSLEKNDAYMLQNIHEYYFIIEKNI